jgi:hypothetical protein
MTTETIELELDTVIPAHDPVGAEADETARQQRAVDQALLVRPVGFFHQMARHRIEPVRAVRVHDRAAPVHDDGAGIRRRHAIDQSDFRALGREREVRVAVEGIGEQEVIRCEWLAILPADARADLPGRLHRTVGMHRPGASLSGRRFRGQLRHEDAFVVRGCKVIVRDAANYGVAAAGATLARKVAERLELLSSRDCEHFAGSRCLAAELVTLNRGGAGRGAGCHADYQEQAAELVNPSQSASAHAALSSPSPTARGPRSCYR